jgi:hypothetical protein
VLQNAPQCNSNAIHLPEGRLRIDEIQQSPNTSIFSSMLFTCPVPTRCDGRPMAEVVTIPLRRHLRIIHAAVIAAFTAMQVQSVRSWHARRASGLPPVADEQPYRAGVGGGGHALRVGGRGVLGYYRLARSSLISRRVLGRRALFMPCYAGMRI